MKLPSFLRLVLLCTGFLCFAFSGCQTSSTQSSTVLNWGTPVTKEGFWLAPISGSAARPGDAWDASISQIVHAAPPNWRSYPEEGFPESLDVDLTTTAGLRWLSSQIDPKSEKSTESVRAALIAKGVRKFTLTLTDPRYQRIKTEMINDPFDGPALRGAYGAIWERMNQPKPSIAVVSGVVRAKKVVFTPVLESGVTLDLGTIFTQSPFRVDATVSSTPNRTVSSDERTTVLWSFIQVSALLARVPSGVQSTIQSPIQPTLPSVADSGEIYILEPGAVLTKQLQHIHGDAHNWIGGDVGFNVRARIEERTNSSGLTDLGLVYYFKMMEMGGDETTYITPDADGNQEGFYVLIKNLPSPHRLIFSPNYYPPFVDRGDAPRDSPRKRNGEGGGRPNQLVDVWHLEDRNKSDAFGEMLFKPLKVSVLTTIPFDIKEALSPLKHSTPKGN